MAVQNLLPDGAGAAISAVFQVPENGVASFIADGRGGDGLWRVEIDVQMTDSGWVMVGVLDNFRKTTALFGEGDYRVRRVFGQCIVDGGY